MAETLRPNGHAGHNGVAPLTEDDFLGLVQKLEEAESAHAAAIEACKAPRKKVKEIREEIAQRMPIASFDRMREDVRKPGVQRQQEDEAYRRAMAWLGKPVLFQAELALVARSPGDAELHRIETEGYESGKAGHGSEGNSWTPGEDRYARWSDGWTRGHEAFIEEQKRLADEMAGQEPPKRGRGRPAGSRNRPKNGAGADAKL